MTEWTKETQNKNQRNPGVGLSVRSEKERALRWGGNARPERSAAAVRGRVSGLCHILWTWWNVPNRMEREAVCTPIKETAMCDYCKRNLDFGISWFLRTLEFKDGVFSASKNFPTTKWTTRRGVSACISDFLSYAELVCIICRLVVFQAWTGWLALSPGQGWGCSLSPGSLDPSDITKGQGQACFVCLDSYCFLCFAFQMFNGSTFRNQVISS